MANKTEARSAFMLAEVTVGGKMVAHEIWAQYVINEVRAKLTAKDSTDSPYGPAITLEAMSDVKVYILEDVVFSTSIELKNGDYGTILLQDIQVDDVPTTVLLTFTVTESIPSEALSDIYHDPYADQPYHLGPYYVCYARLVRGVPNED